MPKYWGKPNFCLGSFPEVGQKQKKRRERAKVNDYNGQYLSPEPTMTNVLIASKAGSCGVISGIRSCPGSPWRSWPPGPHPVI